MREENALRRPDYLELPVGTLKLDPVAPLMRELLVADALQEVRRSAQRNHIFYLYVVDEQSRLCGIVSIRNLLLARDEEKVADILSAEVVRLQEQSSLREAYQTFAQSRFLSLPVVDSGGRIRGVIHAHELAPEYEGSQESVIQSRTRNELFELLGIHAEDANRGAFRVAARRLPWLLINLTGGALCALLIEKLGGSLKNAVQYLALVPILLVVSESIGMQTASIVIANLHRGAAKGPSGRILLKEWGVACLLGLACSVFLSTSLYFWRGSREVSLCIAFTLFLGCLIVSFFGHAVPYLLHRWKLDPRVAAGPLVLSLADCATLLLYLTLALSFSK